MILMDEIDGVNSNDKGAISAINSIIKKTQIPIVCIANDSRNRKLTNIIMNCYDLKF